MRLGPVPIENTKSAVHWHTHVLGKPLLKECLRNAVACVCKLHNMCEDAEQLRCTVVAGAAVGWQSSCWHVA